MDKLINNNNHYMFTNKKRFHQRECFKEDIVKQAFNFAYDMSFGGKGEHRDHRSGGNYKRKNGEIFINTFQGKLSEFGVYSTFHEKLDIPSPDLETYSLGKWDSYDFNINGRKISVKSTKQYGQLMLLETKDWNDEGQYIPNLNTGNSTYDYFILVRISPNGEGIMKKNYLLYSNDVDKAKLERIILEETWCYDIPGYITNNELVYAIQNGFILPKGSILGEKTKMDAENYYIQAGDMHDIEKLINNLI